MTYAEKLKDPRWQKMRLQVLQADNFTCQYCGETTKTLNIHHYVYAKSGNPWDVSLGDLTTLCEDCHKINHIKSPNISAKKLYDIIASYAHMELDCKTLLKEINKEVLKYE